VKRGVQHTTLVLAILCMFAATAFSAEVDLLPSKVVLPSLRLPASYCILHNHGDTIAAFYSKIAKGERYAAYIDPGKCSSSPQYPFEIQTIPITLYTFVGAVWPVKTKVEIWAAPGGTACPGPGALLYSENFTLDQATYALPYIGTIKLSQAVCVNGPFFVSLQYVGDSGTVFPSVMFDSRMPGDSCLNWGYGPTTDWDRWNHYWSGTLPGNLILWVEGETNSATCNNPLCCVGLTGNVDCDADDLCDISDLTRMIDYLYISFSPLCCPKEANLDGVPGIDISDLTRVIDYLYITFRPTTQCQ
jgi:hypothetical protein